MCQVTVCHDALMIWRHVADRRNVEERRFKWPWHGLNKTNQTDWLKNPTPYISLNFKYGLDWLFSLNTLLFGWFRILVAEHPFHFQILTSSYIFYVCEEHLPVINFQSFVCLFYPRFLSEQEIPSLDGLWFLFACLLHVQNITW